MSESMPTVTMLEKLRGADIALDVHHQENTLHFLFRGIIEQIDQTRNVVSLACCHEENIMRRVEMGTPILMCANWDDTLVRFQTQLLDYRIGSVNFYEVELPKQYQLLQRRRAYRATTTEGQLTIPALDTLPGLIEAPIKDISVLGVCIHVPGLHSELEVGHEFKQCTLTLGEHVEFETTIEIKRLHIEADTQYTEIAGEYLELSYQQESMLGKYINNLQIQVLKRYAYKK